MRTSKALVADVQERYRCELERCPSCDAVLVNCDYVNGSKRVQTLTCVLDVCYRPKVCPNELCESHTFGSAQWQQLSPVNGTYGYDVIAQIGMSRQQGKQIYRTIHLDLSAHIQISESQVRYLYTQQYLPLLACHERSHWNELLAYSTNGGLVLTLDGLAPEGGEAQLWVVRELRSGLTLRSGWMSQQSQVAFENFLQPIADTGLNIAAVMSDKQTGLYPAIPSVFPDAIQALCQSHYFKNMAEPVAETDQAMKVTLRKAVRAAAGELIRDEAVEGAGVLTVTGMIPTPEADLSPSHVPTAEALSLPVHACRLASDKGSLSNPQALIADEREEIVDALKRRVRYLLTLKGRPPFRLAGIEMVARLTEIVETLDTILAHCFDHRLNQLRQAISNALALVHEDYEMLCQVFGWLNEIATLLDPDGNPTRSGAVVRKQLEDFLANIRKVLETSPDDQTAALDFITHFEKTSRNYAAGIFHTYDNDAIPRTNNDRESEFRELNRRLLSTTGQIGATRRTILRTGAWELIPAPSSFEKTLNAISQVEHHDFTVEQRRLRNHLLRFRSHSRAPKASQRHLERLLKRWLRLPPDSDER